MSQGQSDMRQQHGSRGGNSFKAKVFFYVKAGLGLFLTAVLVSACGGGGGSSPSAALLEGTFVDSPVQGLGYETTTQSGVTDADGTFMYQAGETVTFHVGDIMLGGGAAQEVMTPVDLVVGAVDETHPMVTNMARFLQSIDADRNPDNGISITAQMTDAMENHAIDFNTGVENFENNPDVQMVMDTIHSMNPSAPAFTMVPIEDARNHLHESLNDMMNTTPGNTAGQEVMAGTFLDSAVEGLDYETATQSGVTDADGTFMYLAGETITFHVGGVELGESQAREVMTPIDLVDGAVDETHRAVTNMARFLQTLDADLNPENGITITDDMAAVLTNTMIDFDMAPENFEHDPNVRMLMDAMNGMDPSDANRMMVSTEEARAHLRDTMNGNMPGGTAGPGVMEGMFIDSAVHGLSYETETQSGVTDANGTFRYMVGESVTFHAGDIVLGEALAQPIMTPVDLVDGAVDETHPMVTNMARFLQTLDADMDPENGITITDDMIAAMTDHMVNFNMDPADFEHDPNVQLMMDALNGMDFSDAYRMVVSIEDAQDHLRNSMNDMMMPGGPDMGSNDDMMGNNTGMAPGNTDMPNGDTGMGTPGDTDMTDENSNMPYFGNGMMN